MAAKCFQEGEKKPDCFIVPRFHELKKLFCIEML